MKRGSPLARKTPLGRARLRAAGRVDPARSLEYANARETVLGRSGGRCELCRRRIDLFSMHAHHRRSRGAGRDDSPANLLALDAACHLAIHAGPAAATTAGRIISRHDQRAPSQVPVELAAGWVLLVPDGGVVRLPGWTPLA